MKPTQSQKRWFTVFAVLAVLAIVAVVLYFFIFKKEKWNMSTCNSPSPFYDGPHLYTTNKNARPNSLLSWPASNGLPGRMNDQILCSGFMNRIQVYHAGMFTQELDTEWRVVFDADDAKASGWDEINTELTVVDKRTGPNLGSTWSNLACVISGGAIVDLIACFVERLVQTLVGAAVAIITASFAVIITLVQDIVAGICNLGCAFLETFSWCVAANCKCACWCPVACDFICGDGRSCSTCKNDEGCIICHCDYPDPWEAFKDVIVDWWDSLGDIWSSEGFIQCLLDLMSISAYMCVNRWWTADFGPALAIKRDVDSYIYKVNNICSKPWYYNHAKEVPLSRSLLNGKNRMWIQGPFIEDWAHTPKAEIHPADSVAFSWIQKQNAGWPRLEQNASAFRLTSGNGTWGDHESSYHDGKHIIDTDHVSWGIDVLASKGPDANGNGIGGWWPSESVTWRVAGFANANIHRVGECEYVNKQRRTVWYFPLPGNAYKKCIAPDNERMVRVIRRCCRHRWNNGDDGKYYNRRVESWGNTPWCGGGFSNWKDIPLSSFPIDPKTGRRALFFHATMKTPDAWGGMYTIDFRMEMLPAICVPAIKFPVDATIKIPRFNAIFADRFARNFQKLYPPCTPPCKKGYDCKNGKCVQATRESFEYDDDMPNPFWQNPVRGSSSEESSDEEKEDFTFRGRKVKKSSMSRKKRAVRKVASHVGAKKRAMTTEDRDKVKKETIFDKPFKTRSFGTAQFKKQMGTDTDAHWTTQQNVDMFLQMFTMLEHACDKTDTIEIPPYMAERFEKYDGGLENGYKNLIELFHLIARVSLPGAGKSKGVLVDDPAHAGYKTVDFNGPDSSLTFGPSQKDRLNHWARNMSEKKLLLTTKPVTIGELTDYRSPPVTAAFDPMLYMDIPVSQVDEDVDVPAPVVPLNVGGGGPLNRGY
jgi:hypothetical protein